MVVGRKRTLVILLGTALGGFFLYLAFRDISWRDLTQGVGEMKPVYLLPCTVLVAAIQFVRAVRFGLILKPFCPLTTKQLWDLLNIWAGATMLLPARLGEFVRPYLLQRRGASFSSAFGAVMVERFFDLSGLLLLLAVVLWYTPEIPRTYSLLGKGLLVALMAGYAAVLLVLARRERVQAFLNRLSSRIPLKAAEFLAGILIRLIDGLGIMASFSQALLIFGCSLLIWVLFSAVTYLFLAAFSIQAPFLVAVTIQVFICLGVALPSAPGFIGTFHAAGRYALAVFGIQSVVAVSFATVYHLFSLVCCLVLGATSYLTGEFRLDQALLNSDLDQESGAEANLGHMHVNPAANPETIEHEVRGAESSGRKTENLS